MQTNTLSRFKRRGIVLVLALAMLGLMALIGVTFVTIASQARVNARNFAQSVIIPQDDELMDFALSQLINDTGDPRSVIHGHSLARDMYGNDANGNGYLTYELASGYPLSFSNVALASSSGNSAFVDVTTNIPDGNLSYYGYNFTRWIMRVSYIGPVSTGGAKIVDQTLEVIIDNTSGGNRVFRVAVGPYVINSSVTPALISPYSMSNATANAGAGSTTWGAMDVFLYNSKFSLFNPTVPTADTNYATASNYVFTLDGRWLRAFNGPGMGSKSQTVTINSTSVTVPNSAYGNFRYNGLSPNSTGMDEDYDACDLENWFLAIQSADGKVIIPSFHRPGVVRHDLANSVSDWDKTYRYNNFADCAPRILRPVAADGNDAGAFPDLIPDGNTGQMARYVGTTKVGDGYDVDNDGDGLNDSVWLDLGYPARRDSRGQLYKPMFAFMVIGLNGRIPLNTAGNLAGNASGNGETHANHLGNSVSEIDPTYALQNAFDGSAADQNYGFTIPSLPSTSNPAPNNPDNSQVDSGGIDVRLTQLRNLLSGTRPQPYPTPTTTNQYPSTTDPSGLTNGDDNFVFTQTSAGTGYPYFMPNGIAEATGIDAPQIDPNTGANYVLRTTQPVPGRWGESSAIPGVAFTNPSASPTTPAYVGVVRPTYNNPVRAGYSLDISDILNGISRDAADDNYNSFDFYPAYDTITSTQRLGEVDDAEFYDASGALLLPIDRMRRWLAPADINGTGSIRSWSTAAAGPGPNRGADAWGRVEYYSYFRPPGTPGVTNVNFTPLWTAASTTQPPPTPAPTPVMTTAQLAPQTALTTLGVTYYPTTANTYFYNVGLAPGSTTQLTAAQLASLTYLPDVTNNPLHGFETFKIPNLVGTAYGGGVNRPGTNHQYDPQDFGGMPADGASATAANNYVPTNYPTYDFAVNSSPHVLSDGLNEADEMNLYTLNAQLDTPFGPADLEWLYRQQDVDGSTLTSRLSSLAPISFTNTLDGLRRRRLFALDSWETNNLVWAFDNPGGNFQNNSTFNPTGSYNPTNASFNGLGIATPSLAHRDKKINLNYPLPVSNSPDEPVRVKWITDAYYLLKNILPPRAVDTPEELAQLGQFVTNIIDFRDPDCTMTHFRNPDVVLTLPKIALTTGMTPVTSYTPAVLYSSAATIPPGTTTLPLDHYGMEYSPIAINEAMAYSFLRKFNNGTSKVAMQSPRFFVELVNTLTAANPAPSGGLNPTAIDLGNANYDLVITNDDAASRPDPYSGQLLPLANTTGTNTVFGPIPLLSTSFSGATTNVQMTPLPATYAAAGPPAPYFNVIANAIPDTTAENFASAAVVTQTLTSYFDPTDTANSPSGQPPTPAPGALTLDPANVAKINGTPIGVMNTYAAKPWMKLPTPGTTSYYWVCLRRPASPFLPPNPDPTGNSGPYNPMIVVDSMRFPYTTDNGTVTTIDQVGNNDTIVQGSVAIYSAQRAQPYRGGHAVRIPTDMTTGSALLMSAYGYSEQTAAPVNRVFPPTGGTQKGNYGIFGTTPITYTTTVGSNKVGFYNTLGYANDQPEPWDWFVFNDRDFTSVAELMLVPGCPPGLFTKQFVEYAPMTPASTAVSYPAPSFPVPTAFPPNPSGAAPTTSSVTAATTAPASPNAYSYGAAASPPQPHTYPYLVDKFFYSGASLIGPTTSTAGSFGGTDTQFSSVNTAASDGWFKMFDFFEVPSQMIGAIGAVANGTNFDWARQDTKPGLLNINLIIDEEVFFSVLGKQTYTPANSTTGQDQFSQSLLNFVQLSATNSQTVIPQIATAASYNGGVTGSYYMFSTTPAAGVTTSDWLNNAGLANNGLKAAFAQFLYLRHGGSNILFSFNNERPFHSLSYPDINYTVMRPATLPPGTISYTGATGYTWGCYSGDPGARNPYIYPGYFTSGLTAPPAKYIPGTLYAGIGTNVWLPEPIPARRLFQLPDAYAPVLTYPTTAGALIPAPVAGTMQSNASDSGDPFINVTSQAGALPPITIGAATSSVYLNNGYPNLVWSGNAPDGTGSTVNVDKQKYLGNAAATDMRQHPNWRIELMQRVMNLTTVRTHQYAVWITVGFFEITKQGDLSNLAQGNPVLAFDTIGPEVGGVTGSNIRYRGFFLVDRTKLTGFDPGNIGSFRSAVVYRKVIQ